MKGKKTIKQLTSAAGKARWKDKNKEERSKIMSAVRRKGIKNSKKKKS